MRTSVSYTHLDVYKRQVLTGWLPDDEGTFRDYLLKDPKNNVSKIVKEGTPGAKEAILDYEVIDMMEDSKMKYTYCLIHLETGRHHQIRVQTSSRGFGLWGDTKSVSYTHLVALGKELAKTEKDANKVVEAMKKNIETEPLAKIDYVEAVDALSMAPVEKLEGTCMLAMAVYIGKTRLIDNTLINE